MTRHILLVDSRDRDYMKYPSSSKYRIDLPRAYRGVSVVRLVSCEIPCTFFVFSRALGNVTFTVGVSSVKRVVTLPDGNYGYSTISMSLAKALNGAFEDIGVTFSVSVDPATLKITISCDQGTQFVVDTTAEGSSSLVTGWGLGYHLGFNKGTTVSGSTITCPRIMALNPYTYLLMDIDGLGRLDECTINNPGNGGVVFAKIPLTSDSWDVVLSHGEHGCISGCRPFQPALPCIDRLTVTFRFHDGTLVDFNGVEHSFTLEFECSNELSRE